MVLFGQMESASNLTSVTDMAEGLQWATLQVKTPFEEDGGGNENTVKTRRREDVDNSVLVQQLFIGNLFWSSPILLLVVLHGIVTMHYADRIPIILCFPAIEIILMQVGFGSVTTAAAAALYPKGSIHWEYTLLAALVLVAAAGWTAFVLAVLWLHCSDDHEQCSYIVLSGSVELQTPKEHPETSDSDHIMTESGSKGVSLRCIGTGSGVQCIGGARSIFSEGSEGEDNQMQNPEAAIPPKLCYDGSPLEPELAKTDAVTEAAVNLRILFAHPVVLGPADAETEPDTEPELVRADTEPELFKLETFTGDAVLTTSDPEMEPNNQHMEQNDQHDGTNDTWAGRCQESGWGERGLWGGGALQDQAEHCFHEMKVTYLHLH